MEKEYFIKKISEDLWVEFDPKKPSKDNLSQKPWLPAFYPILAETDFGCNIHIRLTDEYPVDALVKFLLAGISNGTVSYDGFIFTKEEVEEVFGYIPKLFYLCGKRIET